MWPQKQTGHSFWPGMYANGAEKRMTLAILKCTWARVLIAVVEVGLPSLHALTTCEAALSITMP